MVRLTFRLVSGSFRQLSWPCVGLPASFLRDPQQGLSFLQVPGGLSWISIVEFTKVMRGAAADRLLGAHIVGALRICRFFSK